MKKSVECQEKKPSFFSYKKPWLWLIIGVVLATAVVLTVCLWPPKKLTTTVSSELDACVVSTLRKVHYSQHTEGKYPAVAYTTLGVEKEGDTVTVYGVMMYREYTCTTRGELRVWGAENQTFAVTAKKTDKGYEATECWWPKNGKEYYTSIEEKFPKKLRDQAMNPQQYYAVHDAACKADAEKNIPAADKYVVLESETKNLRLAYCPNNTAAYVVFGGGYNTDGTYAAAGDDRVLFTFGNRKVAFTVDGDSYVYVAAESVNLPKEWQTIGDTEYFKDGVVFKPEGDTPSTPEDPKNTAPVGMTVTASSMNWMDETELREMFGQYVPSSYFDGDNSKYLPVRPIETRAQLDRFIAAYADAWTDLKAENFAQYDEAFFENNYLLLTYYRDGMAASEPKISEYVYVQDGTSLWLSVRLEVEQPAVGDTVVGQWLLFSGIAKEDYKKATGLEAYVERTVTKTDTASVALSFTGKVKQVEGRSMLMECADVPQFSSGVWVELGDAELDPKVGETYIVTYEDIVMPSLPPRITAISITKP
ncbi:MAG: hypothetical protein IKA50_05220 [Clostridia bacterium]|nr:hypothetical protein [Clostridia bacterium]